MDAIQSKAGPSYDVPLREPLEGHGRSTSSSFLRAERNGCCWADEPWIVGLDTADMAGDEVLLPEVGF